MTVHIPARFSVRTIVANKRYGPQRFIFCFIDQTNRKIFYKKDILTNKNRKDSFIARGIFQYQIATSVAVSFIVPFSRLPLFNFLGRCYQFLIS